jgi:biotin carboxylase
MMRTVVIVASCESYRVGDYLKAAAVLRLDVVVATDAEVPALGDARQLRVDLSQPEDAAHSIAAAVPDARAVIAVEDEGVQTAAAAAALLEIPHSSVTAVAATRDKLVMRKRFEAAGVPQPRFAAAGPGELADVAAAVGYPVVAKPLGLTASRGVIRLDGNRLAEQAEQRIRSILEAAGRDVGESLLVEEYVPGREVIIEGVMYHGELQLLAVIDKPDPLEGPYFEETMFVTPSRLGEGTQQRAVDVTRSALKALGLVTGPIHAELRVTPDGELFMLEAAARSIGGLCGRSLSFGLLGESLEVALLRSALGDAIGSLEPARPSTGVLMLPIPASGVLTGVEGVDEVRALPGVDDVQITISIGRRVEALPEGGRYLGFVFASGSTPGAVEAALRSAGTTLVVTVDGEELESAGLAAFT